VLLLIAPNTATAAPAVRLSIFGGQERYWLGRPDGTEYVFDTPLPPDFAAKVIAADANKWVIDKTPREFPPQNVDGTDYSFVTTQITYDKPQFDKGELALVRKPGKNDMLWLDAHLNSAVGEPLARQLSAPKAGEWKSDDMVILISSNAETPALRVPIPATTLAKIKMKELGQQTQAGLYYPTVKAPADLDAFRAQMLAYGNAGRRDPDFRKVNGSKTATDLSGDTVQTMKGVEKVFKHSQTPPYFADHVLNDKLNEMAQFQAEYTALNRITDITMHNGPTSFTDPKTGKAATCTTSATAPSFLVSLRCWGRPAPANTNWAVLRMSGWRATPIFDPGSTLAAARTRSATARRRIGTANGTSSPWPLWTRIPTV
jgi:hypothetical protein